RAYAVCLGPAGAGRLLRGHVRGTAVERSHGDGSGDVSQDGVLAEGDVIHGLQALQTVPPSLELWRSTHHELIGDRGKVGDGFEAISCGGVRRDGQGVVALRW